MTPFDSLRVYINKVKEAHTLMEKYITSEQEQKYVFYYAGLVDALGEISNKRLEESENA